MTTRTVPASVPNTMWVGTYSGGGGTGIAALIRSEDDVWRRRGDANEALNASYGVTSSRFELHYLVDEQDDGAIIMYRRGDPAAPPVMRMSSQGGAPCHLALDAEERRLAVANYATGSVTVYALDPQTGFPIGPSFVHANTGRGPNAERQQSSHAHWVGFDGVGEWLYQTDLGTDEVLAYPSEGMNVGAAVVAFAAPPGSGPRHMALHPRLSRVAYLACELSNMVIFGELAEGAFMASTAVSTLPADWVGDSILAHIAVDAAGRRLYVSNRGHDSIAVFALDDDGVPTLFQHAPSGGLSPRFFLLVEEHREMIVAHERGGMVTVLPIEDDGRLGHAGAPIAVPGAAFVMRP